MELKELQNKIDELVEKKNWTESEQEIIYHLVEEVGEICKALRKHQSEEELNDEVADTFIMLTKLCKIRNIDLEKAVFQKIGKNKH